MNFQTSNFEKLNYYQILQVDPSAERATIEVAYRRLARAYHPDLNKSPESAAFMKQLNIAYATLKDPLKRLQYDAAFERRQTKKQPKARRSLPLISLLLITTTITSLLVVVLVSWNSFTLQRSSPLEIKATATGLARHIQQEVSRTVDANHHGLTGIVQPTTAHKETGTQYNHDEAIAGNISRAKGNVPLSNSPPPRSPLSHSPLSHSPLSHSPLPRSPLSRGPVSQTVAQILPRQLPFTGIASQNTDLYTTPDSSLESAANVFANGTFKITKITKNGLWYGLDNGYWIESQYVIAADDGKQLSTVAVAKPKVALTSSPSPTATSTFAASNTPVLTPTVSPTALSTASPTMSPPASPTLPLGQSPSESSPSESSPSQSSLIQSPTSIPIPQQVVPASPLQLISDGAFPVRAHADRSVNLYLVPGDESTIEASVFADTSIIIIGVSNDGQWYRLHDYYWISADAVRE